MRMHYPTLLAATMLAACGTPSIYAPYKGSLAPPQIVYRIDAQRYFEVVPWERLRCGRAQLYYTDLMRSIHTAIASWERVSSGTFIIDAANDQYLIAPIIVSDSSCQTGDGSSLLCASRLPYSTDAGRTWQYHVPRWSGYDVYMSGQQIYTGGARSAISALRPGYAAGIWQELPLSQFPKPGLPAIDKHLYCNSFQAE